MKTHDKDFTIHVLFARWHRFQYQYFLFIHQHLTLIGNKKQNISYSWIIKNIAIMTHLIKDNRVLITKINCQVVKLQMGKTCTTRYLGRWNKASKKQTCFLGWNIMRHSAKTSKRRIVSIKSIFIIKIR